MPLITSPHFYIFHSSTSYPSHSPHHRPIPRSRTIFPPDPDIKQSNPTKGTKNTTDPTAKRDHKAEFSGAVTKDSLAAESFRSGGDFSRGNPTGVMGVTADDSTLNTSGSGKVREIRGKKSDKERYDEARVDPKKSAEAGASGGGNQASDSFAVDPEGRPTRGVLDRSAGDSAGRSSQTTSQTTHGRSDTGRESTRDDDGRHGGGRGGEGRGSKQSAGSGPTGEVNRAVPNTALDEQVNEPGLDWSKTLKDTKSATDIGSEEDPGRIVGNHLVKQTAKKEQGIGDKGGKIERTVGEGSIFDSLESNENA
ncbi:hypothetical protein L873DRAFT_1497116 [Choiromyces venosus 120613-1]|uniref:Uncharacterized protein n=1 Tax=Choiromyces venosus 120613-1 TaxID=1336337 RepID=A0A3N4J637_9PEZI|nr:hypothetical protein L873DRAFT_1497116 [Choiromyces venosus 120613-1]